MTEELTLLRAIRREYYADSRIWGMPGVGQDDGLRFMQAYQRLMSLASPELQAAIMEWGPHSS